MSDNMRVYSQVKSQLKKMFKTYTQGHVVTLAMMIASIVTGKRAQLGPMSAEIPYANAMDKSVERRMRRWVKNAHNEPGMYVAPFAEALLAGLALRELVLVMDGSAVGRGCMALMVGVVYQRRVLPLAWIVYKGKKGHTTADRHVAALEQVKPLIPVGATVIVLGDGEYDNPEMLDWVAQQAQWYFACRTAKTTQISPNGETWGRLADLAPGRGERNALASVFFTQTHAAGPYHVVAWWGQDYDEPLYLVSNLLDPDEVCYWYHKRFRIETFFSDQKSRGFQIDKSHLSDPARLARLLIAACLAYYWIVYLGVVALQTGLAKLIDRSDRTDLSLFQLGLRLLQYLLKWGKRFPVVFSVPPL